MEEVLRSVGVTVSTGEQAQVVIGLGDQPRIPEGRADLFRLSALARLVHEPVAARLGLLIQAGLVATCAVVELEILFSTRSHGEYETVRADRRHGYEWLPMPEEVWDRALDVQRELARRGQLRAVKIPDLLVAATAERHGVTVAHYDGDFDLIAAITGQPTEWVVAASSVP